MIEWVITHEVEGTTLHTIAVLNGKYPLESTQTFRTEEQVLTMMQTVEDIFHDKTT